MERTPLQLMDFTSLYAVVEDFRKILIPSKFEKAQQPDKNTIQLGMRTYKKLKWIEISWLAEAPRIVEIPPPNTKGTKSTLAKQLQNLLSRMALVEINQEDFERVVELKFADRPGGEILKTLVIEIMGRHSNLLLLDKERKIITLGRQVREHQSRLRPISTGDLYSPPPTLKGIKPSLKEPFNKWKNRLSLIPNTLKKSLQQTYQGLSPALILQIAGPCKKQSLALTESNTIDLSNNQWELLYKNWTSWLFSIEEKNFCLSFEGSTSFQVWNYSKESAIKKNDLSLSLGIYYKNYIDNKRIENSTQSIRKKLIRSRVLEVLFLKEQNNLLNKTTDNNLIQRMADEILTKPQPSKIDIKEAQNLYSKAKKLRRSIPLIKERINHHKLQIKNIDLTELFLEEILDNDWENNQEKIESLILLENEIDEIFSKDKNGKKHKKRYFNKCMRIMEFKSPSGLTIQIGRNHRQNDLISFKQARKGDLWFHAQECPGSHVILKSSNGSAEEEDMQVAANLAALFSRAKRNNKVSVTVVPAKSLKRINGSVPGALSYQGGNIIWGEPANGIEYLKDADMEVNIK